MRMTLELVTPTRPRRSRLIRTLSRSIFERHPAHAHSKSNSMGPLALSASCMFRLDVAGLALVLVDCIFVPAV